MRGMMEFRRTLQFVSAMANSPQELRPASRKSEQKLGRMFIFFDVSLRSKFLVHVDQIGHIALVVSSENVLRSLWKTVSHTNRPPQTTSEFRKLKRQAAVGKMVAAQIATMGGTLAETVGESNRQRLVWLSLLAMPLLFPLALPGMASAVGGFCLFVAFGVFAGRSVPLPAWLANRELNGRIKTLLIAMVKRVVRVISLVGRPRMLSLSHPSSRAVHALMLSAAGLSMVVPVPIISFDNVLPALAIVLIAWGLRLRDGLMLLAGYLFTLVAVASVALLWWGGAHVVTQLLSFAGLA